MKKILLLLSLTCTTLWAQVPPPAGVPSPEKLDHFERIGVTECVFRLPSAPTDEVMTVLDEQAELLDELRG